MHPLIEDVRHCTDCFRFVYKVYVPSGRRDLALAYWKVRGQQASRKYRSQKYQDKMAERMIYECAAAVRTVEIARGAKHGS